MTHQKATRDVVDLLTRPITEGIDIDGDCGGDFSIDGVPIGLNAECDAKFNDVTVEGVLTANGGISAATGVLDMNGQRIIGVADPTLGTDAVPLTFGDNRWANISGDTMTGFLTLNADPTAPLHAATRQYVLNQIAAVPGFNGSWFSVGLGNGVWRQNPATNAMFVMILSNNNISDPWNLDVYCSATSGGAIVAQNLKKFDVTSGAGPSTTERHTATIMVPGGYWYRYLSSYGITAIYEFR